MFSSFFIAGFNIAFDCWFVTKFLQCWCSDAIWKATLENRFPVMVWFLHTCACIFCHCKKNLLDINECEVSKHDCHEDATCNNIKGSWECFCNKGYQGENDTYCEGIYFRISGYICSCHDKKVSFLYNIDGSIRKQISKTLSLMLSKLGLFVSLTCSIYLTYDINKEK